LQLADEKDFEHDKSEDDDKVEVGTTVISESGSAAATEKEGNGENGNALTSETSAGSAASDAGSVAETTSSAAAGDATPAPGEDSGVESPSNEGQINIIIILM
jgi:hypothetical protein